MYVSITFLRISHIVFVSYSPSLLIPYLLSFHTYPLGLAIHSWVCDHPQENGQFTREHIIKENQLPLSPQLLITSSFSSRGGATSPSLLGLFLTGVHIALVTLPQLLCVHSCSCPALSGEHHLVLVFVQLFLDSRALSISLCQISVFNFHDHSALRAPTITHSLCVCICISLCVFGVLWYGVVCVFAIAPTFSLISLRCLGSFSFMSCSYQTPVPNIPREIKLPVSVVKKLICPGVMHVWSQISPLSLCLDQNPSFEGCNSPGNFHLNKFLTWLKVRAGTK